MRYEIEEAGVEQAGAESDDKIDLLRIVALFTAEWRTGLIVAMLAFAVATIAIVRIAPQYEATAAILPKDENGGTQGSNLTALFTGVRPTNNVVSLLSSRTLRDDVIRREDLLRVFHTTSHEAARGKLQTMTKITASEVILLTVRDKDAALAARIANAYVGALESLQESMTTAQQEVQQRFYEGQLQREKDALAAAEGDLEKTQVGSGVVQMDTQTQIGLSAIAATRSQITNLQVQLAAVLQGSTEQNPEVQRLRSQISQLQGQERQMESGSGGSGVGAAPAAGKMPKVNLEYARKLREVRYHESLVNSLANHFEALRVEAGTSSNTFEVMDPAIVPEFPTWPPRKLFLLAAAGVSLLLGVVGVALQLLTRRILADPVQRTHLSSIKQNVRWRR